VTNGPYKKFKKADDDDDNNNNNNNNNETLGGTELRGKLPPFFVIGMSLVHISALQTVILRF
jgi:hypothetical protein